MARKKKKGGHEEHISEAWLIPYADILTLLLALFIVLFAGSQTDQKKMQAMAQSFSAAFGTAGPSFFDSFGPNASKTSNMPSDNGDLNYMQENQKLQEVQQEMEEYIKENNLGEELSTTLTGDGLAISIKEKALFPSGSATLLPESEKIGVSIAGLLSTISQKIVISGHTDNVPISNSAFPSNWDLSTQRALNFMKFILAQGNLDPARFCTVGYGEHHPIAPNDTDEGKAKNRRVEILISRTYQSTQMQTLQ